jgi:hypothetical protein
LALHGVDGKLAAELALSSRFLALVAIWLLGLLAFWHALDGPWLLDDVRLRDAIAALGSQGLGALAGGGWQTHLFLGESGIGRPLAMASFGLNALVSDEIFGFKLVNLLLHLVNGTLVYSLARLLFSVRARASAPVPELAVAAAALVAALVWTVHPLQVSTVAYVVQRTTLLSALFSLWAMLLYARLRLRELAGAPAVGPLAWALPLLILPSLAVLANENGVLIPFFLLALELALFRLSGPVRTRRLLAVYFALALVLAGALALRLLLVPEAMAPGFSGLLFGPGERLLTEARVVAGYVGQVFVPRLGDLAFYYDGIVHSRGWLEPPTTLLSALFLLALAGLGLALLRRRPVAAFGTLLFFAGHATESTFLPLELAFEHRNYLPSLGLILAAVDLIAGAGGAVGRLSPVIGASAVAAVFGICLLRAVSWGSAEQIELTGIAANPPSQRARAGLAQLLIEQGRTAASGRVSGLPGDRADRRRTDRGGAQGAWPPGD